LTTQILNELLPTFGIGTLLGLFGILAGSYGICAAKATKAEHFFGKYTTSGCWSVFGGIFAFFGLAWLSFAFSCHAVCIAEHGKGDEDQSAFYKKLIGMRVSKDSDQKNPIWEEISDPDDIGWLATGTCINFQQDWTAENATANPIDVPEMTTGSFDFETENSTTIDTDDSDFTTRETDTSPTTLASTEAATSDSFNGTTTTAGETPASIGSTTDEADATEPEDHYEKKSIVVAYMSLYLCELVLVFILFIIFIVLSNATGCCYCESNTVDIEESYKNDSSSDEDSSDSSSDDSSDEE